MFLCMLKAHLPCSYDLALCKDEPGIVIAVSPFTYQEMKRYLTSEGTLAKHLQDSHSLPELIPPNDDTWGFGEILISTDPLYPTWPTWKCMWPQQIDPWQSLLPISATLSILFQALYIIKEETEASMPQLVEYSIETADKEGLGMWELSIGLAPLLIKRLLQSPPNTYHKKISQEMHTVWRHLNNKIKSRDIIEHDLSDTYAVTRYPGSISFHCPGNACDLGSDVPSNPTRGHLLSPHNVDNPIQQLTLLTGVVVLNQIMRQEID